MLIYIKVSRPVLNVAKSTDSNGSNVSLLLSADGSGTVFTDNSNANNSITSNLVSQGYYGPFGITDAALFPGTGYLDLGTSSAVSLGLGDYTLDTWFYSSTLVGTQNLLWLNGNSTTGGYCAINLMTVDNQLGIQCSYEGLAWDIANTSLATIAANTWHYYSVQKSGNVLSLYLDGALLQTFALTMPLMAGTVNLVGAGPTGSRNFLSGELTELRLSKGVTRYSGATATIPTAPSATTLGASSDPLAANVSMLMHFNDVFGNSTFTEECSNIVTAYQGTSDSLPVITNFASKFGGASGQFTGGNYIGLVSQPNYGLPGDFTLEFFVNFHVPITNNQVLYTINSWGSGLQVNASTTGLSVGLSNAEKGTGNIAGFAWKINTWHHIAVVRAGANLEVYIDGARRSVNTTATAYVATGPVYIGSFPGQSTSNAFYGNIDELRLTKGVARYTSNFTVPTAPLGNIVNTVLLSSGTTLVDSSINATPVGTNVIKMDPFGANASYSYMPNGINDSLVSDTSLQFAYGTGNFTIEMWVNPSSIPTWTTGNFYLFDHGTSVGYLNYTANQLNFVGTSIHLSTATGLILQNVWTHIAVVRTSGVLKIFVNGSSIALGVTASTWNPTTTMAMSIGRVGSGTAAQNFPGLISNFRAVKGTAVYSANFTPALTPLTAITGTSLLTCQTNPIVDNSSNALAMTITSVVAPSLSATTPFASIGGSLLFNGTTNRLSTFSNSLYTFGTADFGIEFWMQTPTLATAKGIIGNKFTSTQTTGVWSINMTTTNKIQLTGWSTTIMVSNTALAANTWYHICFQRVNGYLTLFINGVADVATSAYFTTNLNVTSNVNIGWDPVGYFVGLLSNIRIQANGTAYQVGDFVPTAQFPTVPLLNANANDPFLQNVSLQLDGESLTKDAFGATTLTANGNVALATTVKQSGNSSLLFTGGNVSLAGSGAIPFSIADFTVEAFIFISDLTANKQILIDFRDSTSTSTDSYLALYNTTGADGQANCVSWFANGTFASSAGLDMVTGYWYHVAVTRTAGILQIFLNGTVRYSAVDLTNYQNGSVKTTIGAGNDGLFPYSGAMDQIRVTKAASRYSSNFLVPKTAFTVGSFGADIYASQVSLNLTGEGANGGMVVTDSSSNAFQPVTGPVSVAPAINATGPFASNNYSYLFTSTTANSNIALGGSGVMANANIGYNIIQTTTYTVECWVNLTSLSNNTLIAYGGTAWAWNTTNGLAWILSTDATGHVNFQFASTNTGSNSQLLSPAPLTLNVWTHIAVVRNGATITVYVNGGSVVASSTIATLAVAPTATSYLSLGTSIAGNSTGYVLNGSLSNVRIVKGTAVYTGAFTPSTVPLTAIANTTFLSLQNATLVDNSTNNTHLTSWLLGNASNAVTPLSLASPFGVTNSGSMSFSSGTVATAPANTGYAVTTGTFTIEAWVLPTAYSAGNAVVAYTGSAGNAWNTTTGYQYLLYIDSNGTPVFQFNVAGAAVSIISTQLISLYAWSHLAVVRNNATTTLYVNGAAAGTSAATPALTTLPTTLSIGNISPLSLSFTGVISNVRIVKGTAVYTTAFTVPTSPLTAITGTSLLAASTSSFVELSSNAVTLAYPYGVVTNTAIYRNGAASLTFTDFNARLNYADNAAFQFGTGMFTIEFWIYKSNSLGSAIVSKRPFGVTLTAGSFVLGTNTSNVLVFYNTVSGYTIGTLKTGIWQHIAIVRTDTNLLGFIDGAKTCDVGSSYNFNSTEPLRVGFDGSSTLQGTYLDDLKITKGVAKYVSNFSLTQSASALNLYPQAPVATNYTDWNWNLFTSWNPVVGTSNAKLYVSPTPSMIAGARVTDSMTDSNASGVSVSDNTLIPNTTYYVAPISTSPVGGDARIGSIVVARTGPGVSPRDLGVYYNTPIDTTTFNFSLTNPPFNDGWQGKNSGNVPVDFITNQVWVSTAPGVIPNAPGMLTIASNVGQAGFWTPPQVTGVNTAYNPYYNYSINNLAANTTYYAVATSTSGFGAGTTAASAEISFTTPAIPAIPAVPTGLTVTAPDPYTFVVTWNTVTNAESYSIYVARTLYAGGVGPVNGSDWSWSQGATTGTTNSITLVNGGWPITTTAIATYFSVLATNLGGSSAVCAQNTTNSYAKPVAGAITFAHASPYVCNINLPTLPANASGYVVWNSTVSGFDDTNALIGNVITGNQTNTTIALTGPSVVWYTRMAFYYQNDSTLYSQLDAQVTTSTTAASVIPITATADATRNQISIGFTPTWNLVGDAVTIYGSTVNPCLGNEQFSTSANVTGQIFNGLTAGIPYYFYAVTGYQNAPANTANSAQVTATTSGAVAVVTSLAVPETYQTQIRLSWALPALTNITDYNVYTGVASTLANANANNYDVVSQTSPNFGQFGTTSTHVNNLTGQADVTSDFIGGFAPATTYYARVGVSKMDANGNWYGANGSIGLGMTAAVAFTTKAATVLTAPGIDTLTVMSDTSVKLTWTAVTGATSYCVNSVGGIWAIDGGNALPGRYKTTHTNVGNVVTCTVTGLQPGTTSWFTLQAVNAVGTSDIGPPSSAFTTGPTAFALPTTTVAADKYTSVNLNWAAYSEEGVASAGYYIYYGTGTPTVMNNGNNFATPNLIVGAVTTTLITGLSNGTTYYFIVVPYNTTYGLRESGAAGYAVATYTTARPAAPTNTVASTVSNGWGYATSAPLHNTINTVKLAWTAVTGALQYNVYISTTNSFTEGSGCTLIGPATSFVQTGGVAGRTYYACIQVQTVDGWSILSTPVSTTMPLVPVAYAANASLSTTNKKFGTSSIRLPGDSATKGLIINPLDGYDFGNYNFTIDGWVYLDAVAGTQELLTKSNPNATVPYWRVYTVGNTIQLDASSTGATNDIANTVSFGTMTAATWVFVSIVRSGSTYSLYLGGTRGATFTSATSFTNYFGPVYVGASHFTTNNMLGNWDNLRITRSVARYSGATSTVPTTTMLTAQPNDLFIQNTSLLLHSYGLNNSTTVYDYSVTPSALTAIGGASQVSFRNRYGQYSISLPAATSSLSIPAAAKFALGSTNFTVEAWVFITSQTSPFNIIATDGTTPDFYFGVDTTGTLSVRNGTALVQLGTVGAVTPNQWQQITFVRSNGTLTGYVNTVNVGSFALATSFVNTQLVKIGATSTMNTGTGYLTEVRFTNGGARVVNMPASVYPDSTTYDPYWAQTNLMLTGDLQNGFPFIVDSSGKTSTASTSLAVTSVVSNPKQQALVTWPSYTWAQGYTVYWSTTSNVGQLTDVATRSVSVGNGGGAWLSSGSIIAPLQTTITGLLPNTTYYFKYSANHVDGLTTQMSTVMVSLTTAAIPVVTGVTATSVDPAKSAVAVGWAAYTGTANTIASLNSYNVYYGTSPTLIGATVANVGNSLVTKSFTGLANSTVYYFAVTAVTSWGESPVSTIKTVTTSAAVAATIHDTSSIGNVITVVGAPTQTTAPPAVGISGSVYLDGISDLIKATAAPLALASAYTIEFWLNPTALPVGATNRIVMIGTNGAASALTVAINPDGSVTCGVPLTGSTGLTSTAGTVVAPLNTWTHLALVNNAGTMTIYKNGTAIATGSGITAQTAGAVGITIGRDTVATVNALYTGYLSNLRIVRNAVYTSNFTAPTTPLTAVTGTALLLLLNGV